MRFRILSLLSGLALLGGSLPAAAETLGTLTLDGLSFISFGNQQTFALPPGSTIQFRFGTPNADGSVPFTIDPGGVSIAPIPMGAAAGELRYSLASSASGTMSETASGREMNLTASVRATLAQPGGEGSYTYSMPFTTETVQATSLAGDLSVEVTGMRLVDGVWYVQLVGATVNKENAVPEPGTAVYTVLSGQFDQIP